ncbi:alpha-actinin, non-muscular, putative [Entamoeba invadens IP1]|uniref:Alpha-actinin, non-muscular, putative n=1 Tax=Entamoeba invadens IP1 TaxID=370355 RepID=A0A0A1UFS3_ENTIV|nr:alpha-actinin, non-muscular, putative [Entamoeba invadens IP1]ELP92925.1 alpha-actinin, non-muscular, putative [Entamoeba invadens IP1]|eukprot:XP_004259696.1 alpha-actinin, non-muscular, putative [Entamoeba invadens IP1]
MVEESLKNKAWVRIQEKLYMSWINEVLEKRNMEATNLTSDMADCVKLINFLELLSGERVIGYIPKANNRIKRIANGDRLIKFLKDQLKFPNPGCSAENIVDLGTDKADNRHLLGLLYLLFRKYRLDTIKNDEGTEKGKEKNNALLEWVKKVTTGYGLEVTSFKSSFSDGEVFLALAHFISNKSFDFEEFKEKPTEEILDKAFTVAQENGIPRVLEITDVTDHILEARGYEMYVSLFHNEYSKRQQIEALKGNVMKSQEQLSMEARSQEDLVNLNVELTTTRDDLKSAVEGLEKTAEEKKNEFCELQLRSNTLDELIKEKKELYGKVELGKNEKEVGAKSAEELYETNKKKIEENRDIKKDDDEEIDGLTKQIEETKKRIEEVKILLENKRTKEAESMASKYVEAQKKGEEMNKRKCEVEEEIEELEEALSKRNKKVSELENELDMDKDNLERGNALQELYLNVAPVEENLREHIVNLHKWAPYIKSGEGFGTEDEKLKDLNKQKEGTYKEILKALATDLEGENDDLGKVLVEVKKDQLKKQTKKPAIKKPTVKKDKK